MENVIVTSRSNIPDTNRSFIVLSKPFLYVVLLFKKKEDKNHCHGKQSMLY